MGYIPHDTFLCLFLDGAINSLTLAIATLKSSSSFGSMIEITCPHVATDQKITRQPPIYNRIQLKLQLTLYSHGLA
jgi:hypothetical protein